MKRRPSALRRLVREPARFGFDAALRILMHHARTADPANAARFVADPALRFPASEVAEVQASGGHRPPRVKVSLIGLIGAAGVLPRLYGELAVTSARRGSSALSDFLDLLSHRVVAFFGAAGIKYRPHRAAEVARLGQPPGVDPMAGVLLALTGYAAPGQTEELAMGADPLLHYAGLFAMRPRSADRLAALVSDWLGRPVEVQQFTGSWLRLPPDQRTALPAGGGEGTWNRLGIDAAIGIQSWDIQARIVLRIGPLDRAGFEALMPDGPVHQRLVSLVGAFLGLETGFALNPVLAREAGFPILLDSEGQAQLGWNTWLTPPGGPMRSDAADAVFEADEGNRPNH
jgi:type VI secretion system protein ImpH